jgi:putative membrane protein
LIAILHNHILIVAILAVVVLILWNIPAYLESKRSKVTVLNQDYILLQNSSLLTKQTMFIPKMTIQFLKRRISLWPEKKQIAGLTVNVRSGITKRSFNIDYQKQADIDSVMKWYKE